MFRKGIVLFIAKYLFNKLVVSHFADVHFKYNELVMGYYG